MEIKWPNDSSVKWFEALLLERLDIAFRLSVSANDILLTRNDKPGFIRFQRTQLPFKGGGAKLQ